MMAALHSCGLCSEQREGEGERERKRWMDGRDRRWEGRRWEGEKVGV